MHYLGEIAALGAATCWGFGSLLFGYAAVRVGAVAVNSIRIPTAAMIFAIASLLVSGEIVPTGASSTQLLWLAASGLIGVVIGDTCFYRSLTILGPRKTTLLVASAPVFATVISWAVLGQQLGLVVLSGIAVTLAGVIWVIKERAIVGGRAKNSGSSRLGIMLGIIAALGQATSLVLAKLGMGDTIPALQASTIRMLAAAPLIWVLVIIGGRTATSWRALKDSRAVSTMLAAVFIGPFIGIWLSMIAIDSTKVGIATTLMATTPILMIPMVRIVYKEKVSFRAMIGTVVAIGGVTMIFAR